MHEVVNDALPVSSRVNNLACGIINDYSCFISFATLTLLKLLIEKTKAQRWNCHDMVSCLMIITKVHDLKHPEFQMVENSGLDSAICPYCYEIWSVDSQENTLNCYHQMLEFKVKLRMHIFSFGWRSAPDSNGGAYSVPAGRI